jgi:thiamine biosynthesis protein ThiI
VAALILVRYGELGLKSAPVRREFERTLRQNILEQFATSGEACRLRSDRGHLYVEAEDGARALRILRRVFGVTSISEVIEVPTEEAAIRTAALALIDPLLTEGSRFAVRARRTGQHAFTSQELAARLGGDILERFSDRHPTVDLTHPTVEIAVEVRDARTYLSTRRERGPGGLPLGVAGRVVALVDGRRGALGAYLLMKRGCRCALVPTAEGAPLVESVLRRFDPRLRVEPVVGAAADPTTALAELAGATNADGVVLPLDVDAYPAAKAQWGDRVVFSPTVGLADTEVDRRWDDAVQLAA